MAEAYGLLGFFNHLVNLRLLIGIFRLNWNIAVARVRVQSPVLLFVFVFPVFV